MGKRMRRIVLLLCCICALILSVSCSVRKLKTEKLRDLEFVIVKEEEIPEELQEMIVKHKEKVMKLSYADQGVLYIVEGYGRQETSGYSIEVKGCYESENAIYFHTNLIGLSPNEKRIETETFPYIVVKLQDVEKQIVFQ